jgi:hypothetical protein
MCKIRKLKALPSITLDYLFSSLKIKRRKKKMSGSRREFSPGRCLLTSDGFKTIPNVLDARYHAKGPFFRSIGTSLVHHCGSVPIVDHLRKPRFEHPNESIYLQQTIGGLPKELLDNIGHLSRIVLSVPTWFTCHEAFRLYGEFCPKFSDAAPFDSNSVLESIVPFVSKLKLPYIAHEPDSSDVFNILVNPGSHPGVITRRQYYVASGVWGATKEHCWEFSLSIFETNWALVHSGRLTNASGTYSVGGKEKVSTIKTEDKPTVLIDAVDLKEYTGFPLDTRPVMIPEFHDIMFDSVYASEFMSQFKKFGCSRSDVWVGHSLTHGGWMKNDLKFSECNFTFEGDASKFDRNMLPWVVDLAFSMTRGCFPSSERIDRAFKHMSERFVNKRLITPDGEIFSFTKGIPSGNVWTSWIGSLCTWIIWHYAFVACPVFVDLYASVGFESETIHDFVRNNISFACYGDDLKFGSSFVLGITQLKELEDWFETNFNYKVRADSCFTVSGMILPEEQTALLRTIILEGLPSTKSWDLWEKLIFGPNIRSTSYPEHIYMFDRIKSLCISRPEDARPVALRATLCFFIWKQKGNPRELLVDLLGSYGLSVDLNVDAVIHLCKSLSISHEVFLAQLELFEGSVVRNFEKVFLSLGEEGGLEHWETPGKRVKLANLPDKGDGHNDLLDSLLLDD